jgi:CYTH domain-containing protein
MQSVHKYARIERERRFLLDRFQTDEREELCRRITDRYIDGTTLRIREQIDSDGGTVYKLTQKIPVRAPGAQQGFITSMYLSKAEFDLLVQLPARTLTKTRHRVPPFGVDVFGGTLEGLILAEAEFDSSAEAVALVMPPFALSEVTEDERSTGGRLAGASRRDARAWLAEFGVSLSEI